MKSTARRRPKAGVVLGVSAGIAAVSAGAASGARAAPTPSFEAALEQDQSTGWQIIVLRFRDPATPARGQEVRVAPAAGSNLYSWKVDGHELLYQPESLADLAQQRAGTPLMYPTVNRVRDSRMTFEGRTFTFEANNGRNFIHGLARRRPFEVGPVSSKGARASAEASLTWDEQQPDWARFPIKHRLTLIYTLRRNGLSIGYRIDNLDRSRLPYGFGLHPYFRIPGPREEVKLSAPLDKRMEAEELLPTGALLPVAGTAHDLRRPVSLNGLALDDVYLGMTPDKAATFSLEKTGLRVSLAGSREFTHLVVYTPADRGFFCIENQTSSTDAHNLWARGKKRESHLLVVGPGKSGAGEVTWTIRRRR